MKRSYSDEEWARKKAYLIRSMFHDIPLSEQCNKPSSRETETTQEIELMRTPRDQPSIGSPHDVGDDNHVDEEAPEEKQRTLEAHTESSSADERELTSRDYEIDFYMLHRVSTPIQRGDSISREGTIGTATEHSRRRVSSSSSSSSSKRARHVDARTQTSLGNEGNRITLNNIYVGVPRVIKLCSCSNHVCG